MAFARRHDTEQAPVSKVQKGLSPRLAPPFSLNFGHFGLSSRKALPSKVCLNEAGDPLTPTSPLSPGVFEGNLSNEPSQCCSCGPVFALNVHVSQTRDFEGGLQSPHFGLAAVDDSAQELTSDQLAILLEPVDRRPSSVAHTASLKPGMYGPPIGAAQAFAGTHSDSTGMT